MPGGTINPGWYAMNGTRAYPLADSATAGGVAGGRLPSSVLVDLSVRYPRDLGYYPFLASALVSDGLVSVTFQVAADPADPSTYTPLAAVSVPAKGLIPYRHYPVQAQAGGVGGWVVFGEGARTERASLRFAGPAAGLLAPRAARPYRPLPVSGLGQFGTAAELGGVVALATQAPLEIVRATRTIEGVARDVAVFRLVQQTAPTGLASTAANVFEQFSGPCGARPESRNCGDRTPIEYLNSVQPDCDGNLTIEFRGCAVIGALSDGNGVVVDCALGLVDACPPSLLPSPQGHLTNEYHDLCVSGHVSESLPVPTPTPTPVPTPTPTPVPTPTPSPTASGSLPFSETFDGGTPGYFSPVSGAFALSPSTDDSPLDPASATPARVFGFDLVGPSGAPGVLPSARRFPFDLRGPGELFVSAGRSYSTELGASTSQRNVSLWRGFDATTLGRRYTLDLKLLDGPKANGGLVVNYRPAPDFSGRSVWFLAQLDYLSQQFGIWSFNGSSLVATPAFANMTGLSTNRWYRIDVRTSPAGPSVVTISATLSALEGPALSATVALTTGQYMPDTGDVGVHADRARTRFGQIRISKYP